MMFCEIEKELKGKENVSVCVCVCMSHIEKERKRKEDVCVEDGRGQRSAEKGRR